MPGPDIIGMLLVAKTALSRSALEKLDIDGVLADVESLTSGGKRKDRAGVTTIEEDLAREERIYLEYKQRFERLKNVTGGKTAIVRKSD